MLIIFEFLNNIGQQTEHKSTFFWSLIGNVLKKNDTEHYHTCLSKFFEWIVFYFIVSCTALNNITFLYILKQYANIIILFIFYTIAYYTKYFSFSRFYTIFVYAGLDLVYGCV